MIDTPHDNESPAYLLHRLVFTMDKAADKILRENFSISYRRALLLLVLQQRGTLSQHELAVALGHSDASVSEMLAGLVQDGHVTIKDDPAHGRRRLVTLTHEGSEKVTQGTRLLDAHFATLMQAGGTDGARYAEMTRTILKALEAKLRNEDI